MKLLRQTLCFLPRVILSAQALALVAFSVFAAPAPCAGAWPLLSKAPVKPGPAKGSTGPQKTPDLPASSARTDSKFADVLPSELRAPAADLQLVADADRRAAGLTDFAMALLAEDNADNDSALAGYRKALEADPGYSELAIKVAYDLVQRNDVSAGIQILKDAIKASPKDAPSLLFLSQIYSKNLKKLEPAFKYAEMAMAVDPENLACTQNLFELQLANNQPKKAEQLLEHAAKRTTPDPKFWTQLGELYNRLHLKPDGSYQAQDLAKINVIYRKAAELGKTDIGTLAKVGDFFVLSRQVKDAIPFYLAALNQKPNPNEAPIGNLREKLARAFLMTDQRDEAIQLLEAIAKESPMRFETFELLGELYEQRGDIDKAVANFERSLRLNSNEPRGYLLLSEMLLRSHRDEQAVATMLKARAHFPERPEIIFSLAITLSQAKKHTESMTAFAEAKAVAENGHEEALNAQFYFQYGAAAEQAGRHEKAAELLKRSIELDPAGAAQACNYLGYMWADRGENLAEAGEMIQKALALEPENAAFLDSLGWLQFKQTNYEQAVKTLLRAVELTKPEDPTVLDHLGDAYQALGKTDDALLYWKKALTLEPANKAIADKVAKATGAPPAAPEAAP